MTEAQQWIEVATLAVILVLTWVGVLWGSRR
jgi:hypothetical protein